MHQLVADTQEFSDHRGSLLVSCDYNLSIRVFLRDTASCSGVASKQSLFLETTSELYPETTSPQVAPTGWSWEGGDAPREQEGCWRRVEVSEVRVPWAQQLLNNLTLGLRAAGLWSRYRWRRKSATSPHLLLRWPHPPSVSPMRNRALAWSSQSSKYLTPTSIGRVIRSHVQNLQARSQPEIPAPGKDLFTSWTPKSS